jgi:kynureninase
VLGLIAVAAGASLLLEAGLDRIWAKSKKMTAVLTALIDEQLRELGVTLASPADPDRRGAHVSISHADAWPLCSTLISRRLVIADFRVPDTVRLGPAPIYTRFVDLYDAVDRIASVLRAGDFNRAQVPKGAVT